MVVAVVVVVIVGIEQTNKHKTNLLKRLLIKNSYVTSNA